MALERSLKLRNVVLGDIDELQGDKLNLPNKIKCCFSGFPHLYSATCKTLHPKPISLNTYSTLEAALSAV